ncbi:hypothetical protein QR680_003505 [Steinernema hermaphroditum]|uniref:L-threonine 3-dehydrogenase, mitochondrial n=1 Tax=Steinernema hermaphroditum TaxID=289476 RepID=A0AA39HKM2_9BILA|nr:hypothetical protein QR680_003505 [Steinernema hermaphroditum]
MSILFLLSALFGAIASQVTVDTDPTYLSNRCYLRCVARCVKEDPERTLAKCKYSDQCKEYQKLNLCEDEACWNNCSDIGPEQPKWENQSLNVIVNPLPNQNIELNWSYISDAVFYVIQFRTSSGEWDIKNQNLRSDSYMQNYNASAYLDFCSAKYVRIAPVKVDGVGLFTEQSIGAPKIEFSPIMKPVDMVFKNIPFTEGNYFSNATIVVTLQYDKTNWPLGDDDLVVSPMWFLVRCDKPDLAQAVPSPTFERGEGNTLVTKVGADMMYRSCKFIYYMSSMESRTCPNSGTSNQNPPAEAFNELAINCSTVKDNDCFITISYAGPLCGSASKNFKYFALNDEIDGNDLNTNITANITFEPLGRIAKSSLYYVAIYGEAERYNDESTTAILGVNLTSEIGVVNSCTSGLERDGSCKNSSNFFVLTDLRLDQLYGVIICSIRDVRNTTLPNIVGEIRSKRPMTNAVEFFANDYIKPNVGLYVGLGIAGFLLVIAIIAGLSYWVYRSHQEKKLIEFSMKQMKKESEERYTEFPKKSDLWELERRNLIIYDEKKLGSGAFGSVFQGKLIGKAKAHKDAQSVLGVSLMRTENCDVAVKMLPEYADDLSKSEFLREIALMKNLGYHERLVNMLACITESEPYCLVVEYCKDGDLLHFLRERCEYMLRLDKLGIDYTDPEESDYDMDMVITLKQLLMFAVQISYGLDYLAQKKYVHRDVAARNILVHDKNYAKIGDFGLCRFIYSEGANYISQGGRLPIKWMSPEAIRDYEFTCKSDVWSFGVLMFEIITLGGTPYPCIQPDDMYTYLDAGNRMEQPDNCPDAYYNVMMQCWRADPNKRPEFSTIRQKLASQLEQVTEEYSYLKLDSQKDYYNVRTDMDTSQMMPPPDPEVAPKPFKASAQYSHEGSYKHKGNLDHSTSVSSDQCLITPSEPNPDWKRFDLIGFSMLEDEALIGIIRPKGYREAPPLLTRLFRASRRASTRAIFAMKMSLPQFAAFVAVALVCFIAVYGVEAVPTYQMLKRADKTAPPHWEDLGWAWGKRSLRAPYGEFVFKQVKKNPDWHDLGWAWGRKTASLAVAGRLSLLRMRNSVTTTLRKAVHGCTARRYATSSDPLCKFAALARETQEKPRTLITGSLGQLGRGLANVMKYMYGRESVVMTDIVKPASDLEDISPYFYLNILDQEAIEEAVVNNRIDTIVHFSALLSAVGENNVPLALKVNCAGVQNILEVAKNYKLKVFIPSTIGAFGPTTPRVNTPDLTVQRPRTIYGVSKVYAELLGEYYHDRFGVDFRSLRFPGIISATKPGGGTTDYAIQIFYDAILHGKHKCYLRPDTRLPMMYDTDCTASVVFFLAAPNAKLSQRTYNVTGFSFTPEDIANAIRRVMPDFQIEYDICPVRQKIADSWPQSLDDSIARRDWGWRNDYGIDEMVDVMFSLLNNGSTASNEPKLAQM